jgi:hypothetical protein
MTRVNSLLLLSVFVIFSSSLFSANKQETGIQVYNELSTDIMKKTEGFLAELRKFTDLNKASVDQIAFPESLKISMNESLSSLITSYELAIKKSQYTNVNIAESDQIKLCKSEIQQFTTDVFIPLKTVVEDFKNMVVPGPEQTEVVSALATDLSIRCGTSSAEFVTNTLVNCLMILDTSGN